VCSSDPSDKPAEQDPRPRPDRERPLRGPGPQKVPALEQGDHGRGFGTKIGDLDADLDRELAEAMGGFDQGALLGEPRRGPAKQEQPPGPRKAR